LQPILDVLKNIKVYDSPIAIQSFKFDILIPFTISNYFRYNGSLTEPTCDEVAIWSVVDRPIIELSEEQLLEFQTLRDSNGYEVSDF